MVEYGGGISNGPAGPAGGSGGAGAPELGGSGDPFNAVGNMFNDATAWVSAQPFEVLVAAIVIFFVGLIALKRAF